MSGKHGRFVETRTEGTLPLRVARDGPTQAFNNEVVFTLSHAPGKAPFSQWHPETGEEEGELPATPEPEPEAEAEAEPQAEAEPEPEPEGAELVAPPADEAFGSVLVIGGRGLPGFRKLPGPLDLPDQRALDSGAPQSSHLLSAVLSVGLRSGAAGHCVRDARGRASGGWRAGGGEGATALGAAGAADAEPEGERCCGVALRTDQGTLCLSAA